VWAGFSRPLLLASISLFVSAYLAVFLGLGYAAVVTGPAYFQWIALISVTVATAATVAIIEHGRWRLGLLVPPQLAVHEFALGVLFASALILVCDGVIIVSGHGRHTAGNGFPWLEMLALFLPAPFHEELLFRGYLFQKIRLSSRGAAIAISAVLFAVLHGRNIGVSPLAVVNVFLAGVLLALAYERYERLWFPIGIHMAWNVISGPVLGFPVSGFVARSTLLRTISSGPSWITGGSFGIEGSVWMGAVEVAGIYWLVRAVRPEMRSES
jgi:membrane protease YdiL (CAAX protease family)